MDISLFYGMNNNRTFSWYRSMWLMVMFDLPTETKKQRDAYIHFREWLLDDGFMQIQYSIYVRYCATDEILDIHKKRVANAVPPEGEVRVLVFTDKQYERMQVFYGQSIIPAESAPLQISIF